MIPEKKSLAGGGGPALSARVAGKCNCFAGKGLTEGEERTIPDVAHKAKVGDLEAWGHFRVSSQVKSGWLTRVGCSLEIPDDIETRICVRAMWILPAA